ncbi:mCG1027213, partial [Mus musculus]
CSSQEPAFIAQRCCYRKSLKFVPNTRLPQTAAMMRYGNPSLSTHWCDQMSACLENWSAAAESYLVIATGLNY